MHVINLKISDKLKNLRLPNIPKEDMREKPSAREGLDIYNPELKNLTSSIKGNGKQPQMTNNLSVKKIHSILDTQKYKPSATPTFSCTNASSVLKSMKKSSVLDSFLKKKQTKADGLVKLSNK